MPLDERRIAQNDTIADLQCSITATLTYLMGRASVAELFGLQGYLSQLASRMTDPAAGAEGYALRHEMPTALRQQLAEIERQNALLRAQQAHANATPAPYRQEG